MKNKTPILVSRRNISVAALAATCVIGSFLIGIRSAGDVQPFDHTLAEQADLLGTPVREDIDGDGQITVKDAIGLLEILRGSRSATARALTADPDGDGRLTLNDLATLLHTLSLR